MTKYNSTTRLKRAAKGSVLRFNGNESDYQKCTTGAGLPLTGAMLQYIAAYPWRWSINVRFVFAHGQLTKVVERSLSTEQEVLLNDLSDLVAEWQTEAALELGDYWRFKRKEWEARVL